MPASQKQEQEQGLHQLPQEPQERQEHQEPQERQEGQLHQEHQEDQLPQEHQVDQDYLEDLMMDLIQMLHIFILTQLQQLDCL